MAPQRFVCVCERDIDGVTKERREQVRGSITTLLHSVGNMIHATSYHPTPTRLTAKPAPLNHPDMGAVSFFSPVVHVQGAAPAA